MSVGGSCLAPQGGLPSSKPPLSAWVVLDSLACARPLAIPATCRVSHSSCQLELRCTKPVAAGEHLCFSYIPIDQPSALRREQLRYGKTTRAERLINVTIEDLVPVPWQITTFFFVFGGRFFANVSKLGACLVVR